MYECQNCGDVSLGDPMSSCCGAEVASVDVTPVELPELAVVLREVFGISETGVNICIRLMEAEESTAADLAEQLYVDRSTVGRQRNHSTDIGLLEKRQRLFEDGGSVRVYSPVNVEEIRKRLTVGLYAWTSEAIDLVEDINREKIKALARDGGSRDGATAGNLLG